MASEIKVDTIVNAGGDNDTGIDLSTNDVIKFDIAGAEKARVHSDGKVGIGETTPLANLHIKSADSGVTPSADSDELFIEGSGNSGITIGSGSSNSGTIRFADSGTDNRGNITFNHSNEAMTFTTAASERARIDSNGNVLIGKTATGTAAGVQLEPTGTANIARSGDLCLVLDRLTNDGVLASLRQGESQEGTIEVSGSTVSYNGFSGLHESSGIATDTPVGTVVSTIDELDVYYAKQHGSMGEEDNPKVGKTRADHAKVKVSDTAGDKAVYGVVGKFNAQGKVMVASVGIGSVRVTGECAKGDLLESNGDGTAKVQSDDIVRSKTIGKVTIGNSNTGVKLVSCVLYCG